jgi:hypothetical protein
MNVHVGDPCADNPCLNGASCLPNSFGGFTCQCPPGFSGQRCEDRKILFTFSRIICFLFILRRSLCFSTMHESRHLHE